MSERALSMRAVSPKRETTMPRTPHTEHHFQGGPVLRDIVIGLSDGLTVPFALAAGLSGAVSATRIVVTAGLAEIAAGSIAMGLGGFLAAKGDAEHYESELAREKREVAEVPNLEASEVARIFRDYGLTKEEIAPILRSFARRPKAWVDFMMRFELGLEEPDPRRALRSAFTIAAAYAAGGAVPLAPYVFMGDVHRALLVSIAVTLAALGVFGFLKGRFTGSRPLRSAFQTVLIGGLAGASAFLLARAIA
jgi:VIT1/CCC1 family predicted Fe2+/Mn2+ transporter